MAAFAQFGSDLDEATKKQIERGKRITEILKQGQYVPMNVINQVAILYAVVNGHLDDVPVEEINAWENKFHEFIVTKPVYNLLKEKKEITPEVEQGLIAAVNELKAISK